MRMVVLQLKQFLRMNLYQHYRVARMSNKAGRIVTELFKAMYANPKLLPPEYQARVHADKRDKPRVIADYVAGMTDRYAMLEHRRLFAVEPV